MSSSDDQREDRQPEERPANRVRQGVTGHNVHRVLLFGLIGVLIAYMVLFFVR
jgi:acid phosphatase family membrane protein YuiD